MFSIIGGDFCSLWIGSINDALSTLDLKDDHKMINIRFMWLRALFNLQDKETGLTCDILNMVIHIFKFYTLKIVKEKLSELVTLNKSLQMFSLLSIKLLLV